MTIADVADGVAADSGSEQCEVPRPQRTGRPPLCQYCESPSWWNGWRLVFAVVVAASGSIERLARWLARGKCSSCKRGFTCYSDDQYPHRQYQLDVVATAVSAMAVGGESAKVAAERVGSSQTSARRWTRWVSQLVEPRVLLSAAQRLEQEISVGEGLSVGQAASGRHPRALSVLRALEELGQSLVRQGLAVCCATGLGRVLVWQLGAHGDVVHLVAEPHCLSPAMALGTAGAGV